MRRYGSVVFGSARIHFHSEGTAQLERGPTVGLDLFRHNLVVTRIDNNGHALVIFCSTPQHGWTANVDVLNGILQRHIRFGHGGLEGVEVYHHQIDRLNAVLGGGGFVLGIAAQVKQPAVNFGVQRFHTTIHHLGKARVIADIDDREPRLAHYARGTAGAENFHAGLRQRFCKRQQAVLVRNRNESTLNLRHGLGQDFLQTTRTSTGIL